MRCHKINRSNICLYWRWQN